jgi:transposase
VATLCFSRATFVRFTRSALLNDWRDGLVAAFDYFGGVPREVLIDFVPGNKIDVLCRTSLCDHR